MSNQKSWRVYVHPRSILWTRRSISRLWYVIVRRQWIPFNRKVAPRRAFCDNKHRSVFRGADGVSGASRNFRLRGDTWIVCLFALTNLSNAWRFLPRVRVLVSHTVSTNSIALVASCCVERTSNKENIKFVRIRNSFLPNVRTATPCHDVNKDTTSTRSGVIWNECACNLPRIGALSHGACCFTIGSVIFPSREGERRTIEIVVERKWRTRYLSALKWRRHGILIFADAWRMCVSVCVPFRGRWNPTLRAVFYYVGTSSLVSKTSSRKKEREKSLFFASRGEETLGFVRRWAKLFFRPESRRFKADRP